MEDSTMVAFRELNMAVLERGAKDLKSAKITIRHEVERWVKGLTGRDAFAFDTVCEVVGVDADRMRRRLLKGGK